MWKTPVRPRVLRRWRLTRSLNGRLFQFKLLCDRLTKLRARAHSAQAQTVQARPLPPCGGASCDDASSSAQVTPREQPSPVTLQGLPRAQVHPERKPTSTKRPRTGPSSKVIQYASYPSPFRFLDPFADRSSSYANPVPYGMTVNLQQNKESLCVASASR
jgi:hypothetical protein